MNKFRGVFIFERSVLAERAVLVLFKVAWEDASLA